MIDSIIFDFGGVLAWPKWDIKMISNIIAKKLLNYNISTPPEFPKILNDVIGECLRESTCSQREIPFEEIIKESFRRLGIEIPDKVAYQAMLEVSDAELHNLKPEAKKVLMTLKEMGLKIGVLSNTSLFLVRRLLEKKSLIKYIDAVVLSREIGYRKPHPIIYWEMIRRLNTEPQKSIFVGDVLEIDIYGAKRIGMIGVLLSKPEPVYREYKINFECLGVPKELKPDYIISNLEEIIEIVKELMK